MLRKRLAPPTHSTKVAWKSSVSGTRSRTGSYGSEACSSGFTTSVAVSARKSVWPSGGAWRTSPNATIPEAPGLLSTTTGWLQRAARRSPTLRATTSGPTPTEYGTTMRTVRHGNGTSLAAASDRPHATAPARPASPAISVRRCSGRVAGGCEEEGGQRVMAGRVTRQCVRRAYDAIDANQRRAVRASDHRSSVNTG